MTQIKKLVELINEADSNYNFELSVGKILKPRVEYEAEFLLENGVIVLPCTDKTTVYEVQVNTEACKDCEHYSEFYGMDEFCDRDFSKYAYPRFTETPYCEKQFWEIVEWKPFENWIFNNKNSFGKTVFLTKEEAEKALAEKRTDND